MFFYLAGGLFSVEARHHYIHQDNFGAVLPERIDGFKSVAHLDDFVALIADDS